MKEANDNMIETYFYELYTEYGTMFFYEQHEHSTDSDTTYSFGKMYEFFTGKEIVYCYDGIRFVDDDVVFKTKNRFENIVNDTYYRKISAYEFLKRVAPYLENDNTRKNKINSVLNILELKKQQIPNTCRIEEYTHISEEFKNNASLKLLKPYMN